AITISGVAYVPLWNCRESVRLLVGNFPCIPTAIWEFLWRRWFIWERLYRPFLMLLTLTTPGNQKRSFRVEKCYLKTGMFKCLPAPDSGWRLTGRLYENYIRIIWTVDCSKEMIRWK